MILKSVGLVREMLILDLSPLSRSFSIACPPPSASWFGSFMKNLLLPAILFVSSLLPAFSITDADITPAALVGKTLTFTIVNGSSPFATTGTWSGNFAASGNAFTATNVTGDFVDISTTFTAGLDNGYSVVTLAKIVEGQNPAQLTLYTTSDGVGHYEVSIQDLNGTGQNGTFDFGLTVTKSPEISVKLGTSTLKDNKGKTDFGSVKAGKAGKAKTVTIKNTGAAKLTGLALSKSGKNASDFTLTKLKKTSLAPGASITFNATFKPKAKGAKNAVITIKSNDKDEKSFRIKVSGTATK